jgi:hypothetical protein
MQLTAKEEKIARLALDKGALPGERDTAAIKLINSLHERGVTVEDIEKVIVREKVIELKVTMPSPPPTVVRKPPSPAPRTAYTAPQPAPDPAKKYLPFWRQVAALLLVLFIMIAVFFRPSVLPSQSRASESTQVSPSPEPTVRRAQLMTPKETHTKRHLANSPAKGR